MANNKYSADHHHHHYYESCKALRALGIECYIHWHLLVSRDHRFAPIVQCLLWLWRPIRERQFLPHLEHVKAVVGLLARHTVFLQSLFSSAFTRCVSSYCDNPSFSVCLQASLSVAVTSQESVFMPSAWRSRLHTSLKRSWGRPVGLFLVASSPG